MKHEDETAAVHISLRFILELFGFLLHPNC